MGRKCCCTLKTTFIIILLSVVHNVCIAQTTIRGNVKDSIESIASASVILKDSTNTSIISYTYSDASGNFILYPKKNGTYNLVVASLGYESKTIPVQLSAEKKEIEIEILLKEKPLTLNEVIIETEVPIAVSKDTINYKTKFFVDGTEQSVEDLLKKIPGLQVDNNGTIKVGNKEIEKLMVEGDDLFEKGYKILSKNMPAYPIEEVEVLRNYSNNRLLKNIEESDKVALNLKLDEKSKRIWFGNIEASFGNDNFYQLKANLMNFGKKNKYYFFTNLNNIGFDATGDIQHLIKPFRINEPASIGDNQSANEILNLSASNLNFEQDRVDFNNAELLSLNAIFNPTKKLKIKTLGFFNWDETSFYKNSIDEVNFGDTNFTNTETYKLKNKRKIAFGKLDITYNSSETKMLEATTKFNSGNFNDQTNLVFNGSSTVEGLKSNNTLFDQKINYTNKFKEKKVFLLTGRYINEQTPQNYQINQFYYQELFPENQNANNVKQYSSNLMQYIGVNAHLLDRKQNGNLLEIQVGNELRNDKLNSSFLLLEDKDFLIDPEDYQNNTKYLVNNLFAKTKYQHKLNKVSLTAKLNIHQLYNSLENNNISTSQSPFFMNPSLSAKWELNDKNEFNISYAYNTTNAKILDVYSNFILTDFRLFIKGTSNFNQLEATSLFINYQLGNYFDRFFANTFISYTKSHDFFSTSTYIAQNYTQAEKILIHDREFFSVNSTVDYYLKFVKTNLKLDLGYSKSNYKNVVNTSDLREVKSNNYNYGVEVRSGFNGLFNFHFGTKWTSNEIKTSIKNTYTNNKSFLDFTFRFNEKFNVQLQSERYYFGNIDTNNTYYFLDIESRYTIVKNKLSVGISGKNLFNTKTFTTYNISDIGNSTTQYRLLPRYVLAKIEYRFK
ncbi:carboxypeptidase-like regulatory domain-containing protein [Joostella sp. CR20]|uniref:carboxypeptidase-like regulatory domain-containing protein n=1 Tax=Joostella sp. CR20 TaxID=2804312 RepID=UPI00313C7172